MVAVVAADSALRQGACTLEQLWLGVARLRGLKGVVSARSIVAASDPASRSPGETRLRLTLVDGGLPRPTANYLLVDEHGYVIAEGDLVYEEALIWLEYDGFLPHTQRDVFRNDRSRERMLRRRGWEIFRFVDTDLRTPRHVNADVAAALAQAPQRIAAMAADRSPEVAAGRRALGLS